MTPALEKRLQALEQRNRGRTRYLWRENGESLQDVQERFRQMLEQGRANDNDDYIIFRWQ